MARKESDLVFRLRANIDDLEKKLAKSRKQLVGYKNFTKGVGSSVATSMSQIFGVGLGISGAVQLGRSIFETTKQLDAMDKALKAISDTNTDLVTSQTYLARVSETLGLEIKGLTQSYIAFTAASKGTGLEGEKSREIFENVSKATAILGLSADDTTRALKAIAQMMSKGKVQAEELRQQLGDRVPGAFNVMAKSMGVTTAQLDKMLKDGTVIADEVLPNFSKELVKTFGGDKIDKIETLVGAQNRLNNAWVEFVENLNSGNGVITKVMMNLFSGLEDALGAITAISKMGFGTAGVLFKDFVNLTNEQVRILVDANMVTQSNKRVKDLLKPFIEMPVDKIQADFAGVKKSFFDTFKAQGESLKDITKLWNAYFMEISKTPIVAEEANNAMFQLLEAVTVVADEIKPKAGEIEDNIVAMATAFSFAKQSAQDFANIKLPESDSFVPPIMDLEDEQLSGVDSYFERMHDVYGRNYQELINYADALGMELNEVNGKHVLKAMEDMQELTGIAEGTIEGLISSFAEGLGTGGLEQAFQNFFDVFGQGLQNMGAALVAQGFALKAALESLNPKVKIAAGLAAIAAGAAISKISQGMSSDLSAGGGGVGTYGGSGSSISNYQTQAFQVESYLYIDGKQLAYELENINSRDTIRRS